MFPQLARFTDLDLLPLRLMVGIIYIASGYNHLKDPETRSKRIEMPRGRVIFLGTAVRRGIGSMRRYRRPRQRAIPAGRNQFPPRTSIKRNSLDV